MGHFPWNEASIADPLYKYIVNDKISDYWSKFDKEPSSLFKELFISMTHPDPSKRISIIELKNDAWLKVSTDYVYEK